jgi:hypothetical protein
MNSISLCVPSITILLAGVLFAQQPPRESATARSPQEITLTGCLNKGAGPAQYVLTDQTTGNKTPVTGTSDLEEHAANHTVKLTGTNTTENGRAMFTATRVEHIAATCMSPGDKK